MPRSSGCPAERERTRRSLRPGSARTSAWSGCVGADPNAEEALAGLRAAGARLEVREVDAPTGIAIILVADDGENVIVVVPGANAQVGRLHGRQETSSANWRFRTKRSRKRERRRSGCA